MLNTITKISLDVMKPAPHPIVVYAKLRDQNSRFIQVQVTSNGEPIVVDSSAQVYISGERIDKERKSFAGSVNDDGTLKLPIAAWLLGLVGSTECDVTIVSGVSALTTFPFTLVVRDSYRVNGDESTEGDDEGTTVNPSYNYDIATLEEVQKYLEG